MLEVLDRFRKKGTQEECRCIGAGEGRIDCQGMNGDCYDHELKQWFKEGEQWETRHAENGHLMDCVCQDKGNQIRIDCTTGNRCHDKGNSYRQGESWIKLGRDGEQQKE